MIMKKLSLILGTALVVGLGNIAHAQVQDVSFTASPVVGYTHWDSKLKLGDAPFWGVRAGFGFGPLFEVRGLYERSFDLKGKGTAGPDWLAKWLDKLEDANAEIERYGGELKLNLWSNAIVTPYLTAGGGIMKFTYTGTPQPGLPSDYKEEQIYGAGGLGVKFNLGQRVALSLEGRDLMFNVNPNNRFLASATDGNKLLHNWTGQASLDLYFGGSASRPADAVSRAYKNMYTGGFRGLKFAIEPGVAYVDFANSTGFSDQWFYGGSAGVDLSSVFGIRGFYYIATEKPNKLSFDTNRELSMYGGNFIARLNMPLGLTPYLNLGAGYLDASKRYVGSGNGVDPKSGLFLFGGAGLEIPLHRYVALHGNVNAMLTQRGNPDITNVTNPEQVKVSTFYQAGLRFNIGHSAHNGRELYENYSSNNAATAVAIANEANLRELNELRASYDARIKKLNQELADAVSRRDTITITRVLREKEDVNTRISTVDHQTTQLAVEAPKQVAVATPIQAPATTSGAKTVTLTTSQFEQLVRRVIADVNKENASALGVADVTSSSLSDLDKILLLNALYQGQQRFGGYPIQPLQAQPIQQVTQPQQPAQVSTQTSTPEDATKVDANIALIKRLDQVIDRLDAISTGQAKATSASNAAANQVAQALVTNSNRDRQTIIVADRNDEGTVYAKEVPVRTSSHLELNRAAVFVAPNFGDQFALNLGLRGYIQIANTKFDIVPDVYFGLGSGTNFGINANVHYNLPTLLEGAINPYLGIGLGYNKVSDLGRFVPNYVLGTMLNKVLGGHLFVDYTIRGAFRNNQIAVGYRFNF